MQIHRIRGANLADALSRARESHGERAVVLSRETSPGGGVTIAVAGPGGPGSARRRRPRADPGLADVRERLARHGASRGLVERIAQRVEASGARGMYALDVAARLIGKAVTLHPAPKRSSVPHLLALVGPGGAGKTTTLAKLGRRLVAGGRRVRFASLDGVGLATLESLDPRGADADRHEIAIQALTSTEQLDERRLAAEGLDALLLDTPGLPLRDAQGQAALARELARLGSHTRAEVQLVLPANAARETLDLALEAFAPLEPSAVVLTKLDETPRPGAALELCLRAKLPIAYLADGRDVRAGLRPARPGDVADLFLRGRLAP